jgi:YgiT-type zinc finger domain-containing protein
MMDLKITVCPTCGSDKIKAVRRTWTGHHREQSYRVPNVEFYECPACGEKAYDRTAMRKNEAHSPEFRRTPAQR